MPVRLGGASRENQEVPVSAAMAAAPAKFTFPDMQLAPGQPAPDGVKDEASPR